MWHENETTEYKYYTKLSFAITFDEVLKDKIHSMLGKFGDWVLGNLNMGTRPIQPDRDYCNDLLNKRLISCLSCRNFNITEAKTNK